MLCLITVVSIHPNTHFKVQVVKAMLDLIITIPPCHVAPTDAGLCLPRMGVLRREDARGVCPALHQHYKEPSGEG